MIVMIMIMMMMIPSPILNPILNLILNLIHSLNLTEVITHGSLIRTWIRLPIIRTMPCPRSPIHFFRQTRKYNFSPRVLKRFTKLCRLRAG
jgi:hypothetical protein